MKVLSDLKQQSVREIDVWFDRTGGKGKSWLVNWLWERNQAYYITPTLESPRAIIQDLASKVRKGGLRPFVVIDIPRGLEWTENLLVALESIKDGLIDDPRYEGETINVRGTKVLVLTNTFIEKKVKGKNGSTYTVSLLTKLSYDRWVINGYYQGEGNPWKGFSRAERKAAENVRGVNPPLHPPEEDKGTGEGGTPTT